jgi:hypothetical protein
MDAEVVVVVVILVDVIDHEGKDLFEIFLWKHFYILAVIVVNVVVLQLLEIVVAVVVVDLVHHIHVRLYLDGKFKFLLIL